MKKFTRLLTLLLISMMLIGCGKSESQETVEEPIEDIVYRSIIVSDFSGDVKVKHKDDIEAFQVYEGMSLLDGDEVSVGDNSDLTLDVDSDKHLFAEANSHFYLVAEGDEDTSKTKIKLDKGSVLAQLQNKLTDKQSFDIETATSTMSVRGTVFRVALLVTVDNQIIDMVEVYNGKVWSNISDSNAEVTLEPGQCALIKEASSSNEETVFLAPNQIDESFWDGSSKEIKILEGVEPASDLVHEIAYGQLSKQMVESLQEVSTSGQELSVTKEDLVVLQENIKKAEEKEKEVYIPTPKKIEVVEVIEPDPEPEHDPEPQHNNPDPQPQDDGLSFIDSSDIIPLIKLFSNKWTYTDGGNVNTVSFSDISFKALSDSNHPNKYNIATLIVNISYYDGNTDELEAEGCDEASERTEKAVLNKIGNGFTYQLTFPDSKYPEEVYELQITPAQNIGMPASLTISKTINNVDDYSHNCSINNNGYVYLTYYNTSEMIVYETSLIQTPANVSEPTAQFKIDHTEHENDTVEGYYKDGVKWTFGTDITEDTLFTFEWTQQ